MSSSIINLFHHIHHEGGQHKVHHCGGEHKKIDPVIDYTIAHCGCGKHKIDKQEAVGHATGARGDIVEVNCVFDEQCSEGGWHIESGNVKQ